MQYFDCGIFLAMVWFILLPKSSLVVATSVLIPKKNQLANSKCGTKMGAEIKTSKTVIRLAVGWSFINCAQLGCYLYAIIKLGTRNSIIFSADFLEIFAAFCS